MSEEFGRYRLDELIGRGGMGEVWKAYDREHRRTVAVKRITPADAHDSQFRERFLRESRLAVGLSHPNIIPIFDFGEIDDRAYVANGRGRSVSVVDVVNSAVTTTVDIGTEPSAVTVTPDGDRVVVASRSAGTLTAVDVGSNEVRSTTPVGGPADVVAVPGTGRMLVVQTDYGTITQLDGF